MPFLRKRNALTYRVVAPTASSSTRLPSPTASAATATSISSPVSKALRRRRPSPAYNIPHISLQPSATSSTTSSRINRTSRASVSTSTSTTPNPILVLGQGALATAHSQTTPFSTTTPSPRAYKPGRFSSQASSTSNLPQSLTYPHTQPYKLETTTSPSRSVHSSTPMLSRLLSSNAEWAADVGKSQPNFFEHSAKGQSPKVLWIGCADSRVPESVLMACRPGEIFVHRNIANQFHLHDDSAQSVLAYAVEHLGVEHVVVVGHTGCGGVAGALSAATTQTQTQKTSLNPDSPLSRWLTPLINLACSPKLGLLSKPHEHAFPALVEANVRAQVANVCQSDVIQRAWAAAAAAVAHNHNHDTNGANGGDGEDVDTYANGRDVKMVHVHGWVYELETGRLRDLGISCGPEEAEGSDDLCVDGVHRGMGFSVRAGVQAAAGI